MNNNLQRGGDHEIFLRFALSFDVRRVQLEERNESLHRRANSVDQRLNALHAQLAQLSQQLTYKRAGDFELSCVKHALLKS